MGWLMPMPGCSGVSPLQASSTGLAGCWGGTGSPPAWHFQLTGAGQGRSTGNLGKSAVSMTLPNQASAVICSHFPLCALCWGVVQEMQRHRNQSRGRCQVLLSTSQPLASTPSFTAVIVSCELASHSLQAINPDNKKVRMKMQALGILFSALLLLSLSVKESFPERAYL